MTDCGIAPRFHSRDCVQVLRAASGPSSTDFCKRMQQNQSTMSLSYSPTIGTVAPARHEQLGKSSWYCTDCSTSWGVGAHRARRRCGDVLYSPTERMAPRSAAAMWASAALRWLPWLLLLPRASSDPMELPGLRDKGGMADLTSTGYQQFRRRFQGVLIRLS